MNDPNKAISVNLSSLLSLKAELQRKQHEVKLAKATKSSATEFRPNMVAGEKEKTKSKSSSKKEHNYKEISSSENAKVYETEDMGQLEKSRRVLEAKSKFYDRMSRSGGSLNSDDNCLVMFNRKRQEQDIEEEPATCATRQPVISSSSSSSDDSRDSIEAGNDDDEVEYTDCLGRTRKCLRHELSAAKKRDKQLADSMPERLDQTKANWMIDTKGNQHKSDGEDGDDDEVPIYGPRPTESVFSEALSTMTKHDEQRANWERKEQENVEKPDVHYQDVFFDEARTHGVSYYAFSTDEAERAKQQSELEKARKATEAEQKRRDELRIQRDKIVADRVLAAKNRIRARNGLPPISKEEYEREQQLKTAEATAKALEIEREKTKENEAKAAAKAAEEAEREELRKEYIRDWDRDKNGVPKKRNDSDAEPEEWQYRAERLPMSQEQWNEKQRTVRTSEFAPVPEAPPKRTNFSSMPPPMQYVPSSEQEYNSFHSTKREKQFQRRNYTKPTDDADEEVSTSSHHGAAIPPPACLDAGFGGPPDAKRAKSQADLERSIEAGLKFLRNNCDKGVLGNKATWTAKADY